jgi:hypothetical protein
MIVFETDKPIVRESPFHTSPYRPSADDFTDARSSDVGAGYEVSSRQAEAISVIGPSTASFCIKQPIISGDTNCSCGGASPFCFDLLGFNSKISGRPTVEGNSVAALHIHRGPIEIATDDKPCNLIHPPGVNTAEECTWVYIISRRTAERDATSSQDTVSTWVRERDCRPAAPDVAANIDARPIISCGHRNR